MSLSSHETEQCCICLRSLLTAGLGRQGLPCGHVMHEQCIAEMRRHGGSERCPLCRQAHDELTSVQTMYDKALLLYLRKDYHNIVRLLRETLDVHPEHAFGNHLLGKCYRFGYGIEKDDQSAMECFDVARRCGNVNAALLLGQIHYDRGDLHKAQKLFEEVWHTGDGAGALNLGEIYKKQGDIRLAQHFFEEAWRWNSDVQVEQSARIRALAAFKLGFCYNYFADLHKSQQFFEEALRWNSDTLVEESTKLRAAAALNLGNIHQTRGDMRKAEEFWGIARRSGNVEGFGKNPILKNNALPSINVGDRVQIHSLSSAQGLGLNGLIGTVVKNQRSSGRRGVKLEGHAELKSIHEKNLIRLLPEGQPHIFDQPNLPFVGSSSCSDSNGVGGGSAMMPSLQFVAGDLVSIRNLASTAGRLLNGLSGAVVSFDKHTSRYGVDIPGVGLKSIKSENLALVQQTPASPGQVNQTMQEVIEEIVAQPAMQAGIHEAMSADTPNAVNAQVSAALLESSAVADGPRVTILKFSRRPAALRELLHQAPELAACRDALIQRGLAVELASGAKVFVAWQHYEAVMEALRLEGCKLHADIVIADMAMEAKILQVIQQLRGRDQVHLKDMRTMPLAFPEAVAHSEFHIEVYRTFISIRIPSSMRSDSQAEGVHTVSTTDMDRRKGSNPRSYKDK